MFNLYLLKESKYTVLLIVITINGSHTEKMIIALKSVFMKMYHLALQLAWYATREWQVTVKVCLSPNLLYFTLYFCCSLHCLLSRVFTHSCCPCTQDKLERDRERCETTQYITQSCDLIHHDKFSSLIQGG